MAQLFNSTSYYNPFNQPNQPATIENLVALIRALIQQIQRLDKKCNLFLTTLTTEQHKVVLNIINQKFPEATDDKQIPEALEFTLGY
ncbi:5672_t:CDS:2 [Racocetra fulgida]|uniref:5672_t:CDS:1 n=1 Tax=Racocetra fulgida TaxID=60492 RepID=A0A9N9CXX8_9GLOM|nr:5672_t:CDS:2 [Racocetra fulgida]